LTAEKTVEPAGTPIRSNILGNQDVPDSSYSINYNNAEDAYLFASERRTAMAGLEKAKVVIGQILDFPSLLYRLDLGLA
jgi:hypothetical protein